jgi:predicted permease
VALPDSILSAVDSIAICFRNVDGLGSSLSRSLPGYIWLYLSSGMVISVISATLSIIIMSSIWCWQQNKVAEQRTRTHDHETLEMEPAWF